MSENDTATQDAGTEILPVIALRDMVMFPGVLTGLRLGRARSVAALKRMSEDESRLLLLSQRDAATEEPGPGDLYEVGVISSVSAAVQQPDGTWAIVVHGLERCRVLRFMHLEPYVEAEVAPLEEVDADVPNVLRSQVKGLLAACQNGEAVTSLAESVPVSVQLAGIISFHLTLSVEDKQRLLSEPSVLNMFRMLIPVLQVEVQIATVGEEIRQDEKYDVSPQERLEYLRSRRREIEDALDGLSGEGEGLEDMRRRIEEAELPPDARQEAEREMGRLVRMGPGGPERGSTLDYLSRLADLPWRKSTDATVNLRRAQRTLDRDHYDRERVKERILEHLSVQMLRPESQGAVLCFVGAPGVGKTSMGRSIAEATGRRFYRVALGGVRDEAEIRGHRRTYIGALPGCIIRAMGRIGVNNPVLMLDEVDKLTGGTRGDPASALLEVLDPEQNVAFVDNYLGVPFDLSHVMFICTANTLATIPAVLLDRLEVIELPGYVTEEKVMIASRYLVARQLRANGVEPAMVDFTLEAVEFIVERYTREAGVRGLERRIAAICRKIARQRVAGRYDFTRVDPDRVVAMLGPPKWDVVETERALRPGICPALVISSAGGELQRVEVVRLAGEGKLLVTGRAGETLKESATLTFSYWKARAQTCGLADSIFGEGDFHVHFPGGAVAKEGAGSGLPMALAFASALSGRMLPDGLAALGEVTLRGLVLEVEHVPERFAAAARAGITHVIIPERNRPCVEGERERQLPEGLRVTYVHTIDDALAVALPGVFAEPAGVR